MRGKRRFDRTEPRLHIYAWHTITPLSSHDATVSWRYDKEAGAGKPPVCGRGEGPVARMILSAPGMETGPSFPAQVS